MKTIHEHTMTMTSRTKTDPGTRVPAILLYLMLSLLVTLAACNEPTGYEGPQGPEGPRGEVGPVGPAGEDGSTMYAGPGASTADIGQEGDYYLNTTTGEYYGPKDGDGWGNPIIVLKGEDGTDGQDGQDGEDGTKIHSGDGAPDASLGVEGDFYMDRSNQDLYGPKTDSGWGDPISLNGEDGQDGQDGEDGSQIHSGNGPPDTSLGAVGDYYFDQTNKELYGPKTDSGWGTATSLQGPPGQDGEDGSQIHSGSGPPNSSLGRVGNYYLDRSNYELYGPKTNGGWGAPLNLQGPRGPAGPAGEDGSVIHAGQGAPADNIGKNGDFYLNKNSGELYGPKSDEGWGTPISLQGPPGEDGQDGAEGSQIYAGSGAPDTSLGVEGDYYLDKADYELYGPKTASGWGTPISLKGTANVLYSSWLDIDLRGDDEDAPLKIMYISESRITVDFLNTGIVLMYLKENILIKQGHDSANDVVGIRQLPVVFRDDSRLFFNPKADDDGPLVEGIGLFQESLDGTPISVDLTDDQIRYVLIPGGVAAKSKLSKEQLQEMSYQEVKERFDIRD